MWYCTVPPHTCPPPAPLRPLSHSAAAAPHQSTRPRGHPPARPPTRVAVPKPLHVAVAKVVLAPVAVVGLAAARHAPCLALQQAESVQAGGVRRRRQAATGRRLRTETFHRHDTMPRKNGSCSSSGGSSSSRNPSYLLVAAPILEVFLPLVAPLLPRAAKVLPLRPLVRVLDAPACKQASGGSRRGRRGMKAAPTDTHWTLAPTLPSPPTRPPPARGIPSPPPTHTLAAHTHPPLHSAPTCAPSAPPTAARCARQSRWPRATSRAMRRLPGGVTRGGGRDGGGGGDVGCEGMGVAAWERLI